MPSADPAAVLETLLRPATFLLDPAQRLHVGYLAFAAVVALVVLARRGLRGRALWRSALALRLWRTRSSKLDLKLLWTNAILKATVLAPLTIGTVGVTLWSVRTLGGPGQTPADPTTRAALAVGYTLALFVADDLTRYLLHRLMHRVPALWAIHQVHHSAEVLTPATLHRSHPIESVLNGARASLTLGLVAGAFVHLFGPRLGSFDIAGVNAIALAFAAAGSNLRHSHAWISYGPTIERLLISPAQHQLHHSRRRSRQRVNYGAFLALWDGLAGTLERTTSERPALRFGLLRGDRNHGTSLWSALVDPPRAAVRVRRAQRRRDRLGWLPWAAAAAGAFGYACVERSASIDDTGASSGSGTLSADPTPAIVSITDRVILPAHDAFVTEAEALETAAATYAGDRTTENRDAVQQAWRDASAAWQAIEVMQVGPAGAADGVAGGAGLRDEAYSWPLVNPCRVDQELTEENYADASAFASELVNVRGLDALEYLLFTTGTENACAPQNAINMDGSWAALSSDDLDARRAAYAATVATLLHDTAVDLRDRWSTSGGDFASDLKTAGTGSATYATKLAGLNALSDAMFYVEKQTKDTKLGVVLGIGPDCDGVCPNPAELESKHAGASRDHALANVRAFQRMFHGGDTNDDDAYGFDDLLIDVGAADLAARMTTNIALAIAALQAIDEPTLAQALVDDPDSVKLAYDALSSVAGDLKNEMVVALFLELPASVSGDND